MFKLDAATLNGMTAAEIIATVGGTSVKPAEPFAPAGTYPATYAGGAIPIGATFYITAPGTVGAVTVATGDLLWALVATPGQTAANWLVIEHNLVQATEVLAGLARLATSAEAIAGTDNTTIITPQKLAGTLIFKTVAPTGANYATVGAAVAAGATEIIVMATTTEVADVTLTSGVRIWIRSGATVQMGVYQFKTSGGTWLLEIHGGTISYSYSDGTVVTPHTLGKDATVSMYLSDCVVDNNSTSAYTYVAHALALQKFVNVKVEVPNYTYAGINIDPTDANVGKEAVFRSVEIVGGGTSCDHALCVGHASVEAVLLSGTYSTTVPVICTSFSSIVSKLRHRVTGVWVPIEVGGTLRDAIFDGGSGKKIAVLTSGTLDNIDGSNITVDLQGAGFYVLMNVLALKITGAWGDRTRVVGCRVTDAGVDATIDGTNANIIGTQFDNDVVISGDTNVLTGCKVGGSLELTAASQDNVVSATTVGSYTDDGTNNTVDLVVV